MKATTVVIPAFNEEAYIAKTIEAVVKSSYVKQVVVIDDASLDRTFAVAKQYPIDVYKNKRNLGKGKTLEMAKKYISGDFVIMLDADIGESALEIDKLILALENNSCDVSIAVFPKTKKGGFGIIQGIARKVINYYTGKQIQAPLSGQRAMKRETFKQLEFGDRYSVELIMTIDLLMKGYKLLEIPVQMKHRELGKSLRGFLHRARQLCNMMRGILKHKRRWKC